MKFTDKLDMLMKVNGLNKRSFAQKCDIPYTTVCGWYDRGYDGVRMNTVRKIAEAFNTDLEYWAYDDLPEKENSSTADVAMKEEDIQLTSDLRRLFVKHGLIEDGGDITPEQSDIIFSAIVLLRAALQK